MDISNEKAEFLKRFEQVNDIEVVMLLNTMLDFALPNQRNYSFLENDEIIKDYNLSEEHRMLLKERLKSYKNYKEDKISWDEVKKKTKKEQ